MFLSSEWLVRLEIEGGVWSYSVSDIERFGAVSLYRASALGFRGGFTIPLVDQFANRIKAKYLVRNGGDSMGKIILYVLAAIGALALASLAWATFTLNTSAPKKDATATVTAKVSIRALSQALLAYSIDASDFPSTDEGLQVLVQRPEGMAENLYRPGGYIQGDRIPLDPWGNPFQYRYIEMDDDRGRFEVFSFGPDGVASKDDISTNDLY